MWNVCEILLLIYVEQSSIYNSSSFTAYLGTQIGLLRAIKLEIGY